MSEQKICEVLEPTLRISAMLEPAMSGKLPIEVLTLDVATAAIVVDVDGVDYILTVTRVPKQRPRPIEM